MPPSRARPAQETTGAQALPFVLLMITGTLIGVFAVLAKAAANTGWDPVAYLFWGLAGSGIALTAAAVVTRQQLPHNRHALLYYLGSGLLSGALPNALSFAAVPHVGASFVALGFAFPPLLSYAMALVLRMERYRTLRTIGLLLGLVGVVIIVIEKLEIEGDSVFWIAIALTAPVIVAGGNIFRSLFWPPGATPSSLVPGMLLAATLLLAPYLVVNDIPIAPPLTAETVGLALVLVAVFAGTFRLIFLLQSIAGPVYLAQIGSVGAAAGAALAVAIYNEPAGIELIAATAIILTGAFLVNRTR
ncbi:EamA family transporter [Bauldia sp.]|uniref:EamA family transporter n=1 Tax=Bauldia sp. TaxID=2575872 RepID=UPI003BA9D91B